MLTPSQTAVGPLTEMYAGGLFTGVTVTLTGAEDPEHPFALNAVTEYTPEPSTVMDEVVSPSGYHK